MNKYGYWTDPLYVHLISQSLKKKGIVAGTSDTVPGLLAPLTKEGKAALDVIKIRQEKPYLILVGSGHKAAKFSDSFNDPVIQKLITQYWPGPLTLVVPAKKGIADFLCSADGTIALRVPDHAGLQQILAEFDGLFSTSANLAGHTVPATVAAIDPIIKNQVDLLVDDKAARNNPPSTIIAYRDGELTILREGTIKI